MRPLASGTSLSDTMGRGSRSALRTLHVRSRRGLLLPAQPPSRAPIRSSAMSNFVWSTPSRSTSRSGFRARSRHLVLPRRDAGLQAAGFAAGEHPRAAGLHVEGLDPARPRRWAARTQTPRRRGRRTRRARCWRAPARRSTASVSSNRKSETTGTSEVLREKPIERRAQAAGHLQVLQPASAVVGLEAVNHLALADARPHGAELARSARRT